MLRLPCVFTLAFFTTLLDARWLLADSGHRKYGCYRVTASGTINLASDVSCGTRRCPPCFFIDTTFAVVELTLSNCHLNDFFFETSASVLTNFQFTNGAHHYASVSDGVNTYVLPSGGSRGSAIECNCYYVFSGALLSCDASITPVAFYSAYNAIATSDGCAEVSTSSLTLHMQSNACNSRYCPACYILDTTSNVVSLTISNCGTYQNKDLSSTDAVVMYQFINIGTNLAHVSDGTQVYTLAAHGGGQSSTQCFCKGSSFHCDVATMRPVAESVGVATFAQSLSVADVVKFGDNLEVFGYTKYTAGTDTYVKYNTGTSRLESYIGGSKTLSMGSGTGTLHGTWASEAFVTVSDSRLKKNVRPLHDALRDVALLPRRGGGGAPRDAKQASAVEEVNTVGAAAATAASAQWVLRQLRPVSYMYRRDPSNSQRFGFIAEEVAEVLPSVVRVADDPAGTKQIHQLDFIALLVAASQSQQLEHEALSAREEELRRNAGGRLSALEADLGRLAARVERLSARVEPSLP